jgi:hypothetical protein
MKETILFMGGFYMEKQKFEIQFVKPENVFNKTFHSTNPEIIVQKLIDAGYVVLECQKSKKEEKYDVLLPTVQKE